VDKNKVIAHAVDRTFRNNLLSELSELRKKTLEDIGSGVDDYRYWVGYLRCLDDIILASEGVMKDILEN
jgi:hypothetical protein